MKVRIGIGSSGRNMDSAQLEQLCVAMMEPRFDSIWIPEVLTQPGLDPLVSLAWLAGRLPRLKIGTTFLVPGRNVLRLARQLAALDHLSDGRLLLTAVPGLPRGGEATASGVAPADRGKAIDESLPILRSLMSGVPTDVPGALGNTPGVVLDPVPLQQPLEIWLGGSAPGAIDRCGRLGDGWLPAMITPEQALAGRMAIEEVAAEHNRSIDPEHFGVSIGYSTDPIPTEVADQLRLRARREDLDSVVPVGLEKVRTLLERYVDVGFSKFVLRPLMPVRRWEDELAALAEGVGSVQT